MIDGQRVIIVVSRPDRVISQRIKKGSDPQIVLKRYAILEPGEQIVSATIDGKPINNPSALARQKGETR